MLTPFLPALAAALFCIAPPQSDDAGKARLKSALEATGLKHEASPSGLSYTVLFDHPGNRQQKVYVATALGKPGGLVTHLIYTTVWVNKDTPPDEATMRQVFTQSKKLGHFYLWSVHRVF